MPPAHEVFPPRHTTAAGRVANAWAGTDWADRRGWLSKNVQLMTDCQRLGKMSCFTTFSNFAESQKELKTDFEILYPFFIFPFPPVERDGLPPSSLTLGPSSR